MTSRIGIDLVEISEVADSIDRFGPRYLERILTDAERSIATTAAGVAAAFAGKEAVIKAIGLDASAVPLTAIEITGGRGEWQVTLTGSAEALAREDGIVNISLSLSTTGNTATAVAVAMTGDNEGTRFEHGRADQGSDRAVRQARRRGVDSR